MAGNRVTRRTLIGGLLAGAAALGLAACGGGAPAAAPSTTATAQPAAGATAKPAAQATTAPQATTAAASQPSTAAGTSAGKVVWLVRSDPVENKGQETIFLPAIKEKYPNIQVERIIVPSNEYDPKINTMGAAKEPLDIWGFGQNYMDYWARGLATALDQYIQADKWDIDAYFLPGLPEIFRVHGHYYGLNQQPTYGSVLVYNKQLLDEAGLKYPPASWDDTSWTFDTLLSYAHKLTKNYGTPDGQYGVNLSLDTMTDWAWLEGTDNFLPEHYKDGIAPKTTMNNPGNIAGLQLQHDWIYKEKVNPDPSLMQGLNTLGDPFQTSKVAIELTGGWLYWTLSTVPFKFGYAPYPTLKTNKNHNYDDFWIMGSWVNNKDDAWKVMRVLTDVKPVTDYSALTNAPPAVRAATDPWLQKVSEHTGQSVDDLKQVTSGAIVPSRSQESEDHLFIQYHKISDVYNNEIQPLWADSSKTAAGMVPDITTKIDGIVAGIYNQYKDSLPKD